MARARALRSLANFFDDARGTWRIPWKGKQDFIEVGVDASTGYRQRTIRNASESDVTISVARDFESAGERLTRNSTRSVGKPHVELAHDSPTFEADVAATVAKLNEVADAKGGPLVINAAGNGLSTLRANQDVPDMYAMRLLDAVLKSPDRRFEIAQVRSGGQTGYDIAFIKAALANDIPVKIHAARGKETGGFLLRRRNNRDAELSLEEYLDELEVNGEAIQRLVEKMRGGVQAAVDAGPLPRPAFRSAMNYVDGDQGLRMRPEFAGKSTMDLIISGDRTGTSRQTRYLRNVREGKFIEFEDRAGRKVLVRVTSDPQPMKIPDDPNDLAMVAERWSKLEGWGPENYEKLARQGYSQYTYEVVAVDGKRVGLQPARPREFTRIDLDEPTVADVDEQLRLLEARGTGRGNALEDAIAEEQNRLLGITRQEQRAVDIEKGEVSAARRDTERDKRRALERMKAGKGGGRGMEDVRLEDLAQYAPELLDDRPTFDMDLVRDFTDIEMNSQIYQELMRGFNHKARPATEMGAEHRIVMSGVRDVLRKIFKEADSSTLGDTSTLGDLSGWDHRELKTFITNFLKNPKVDDSLKEMLQPTAYYLAVLKADSFFPVTRVVARTPDGDVTRLQRVFDVDKFPNANTTELNWLQTQGRQSMEILLDVISGGFYGPQEKAQYMRIVGRNKKELERLRMRDGGSDASDAIDEIFKYFENAAWNAGSRFEHLPAKALAKPVATRFLDRETQTPRINTTIRGRNGEPIDVSFQWDEINGEIMPTQIFINGKEASTRTGVAMLEELFEIDASYHSLIGDPSKLNRYYRFELGYRNGGGNPTENLLGRELTSTGIKFDDGETLLDKFIFDVLGYRNLTKYSAREIILREITKEVTTKVGGKTVTTRKLVDNPQLFHATEGKPASAYARQYRELVRQAFTEPSLTINEALGLPEVGNQARNVENLVRLSDVVGRRQLSSRWDINFWGDELTPAHALTRLMHERRLRNARPTRRIRGRVVEEAEPEVKLFRSREDMPPDGPLTDDEIWYAYRPGEIREMPREQIESVIGAVRGEFNDADFLTQHGIVRPFQDRIVTRQVKGRQPREPKPKTESQKAGRIVPRTDEEKALIRAKLTDEYGFQILTQGDEVVDILRKPNSHRHFGNPYPIDDAANIVQRVHANTKFEYYLLNGSAVEQFSPGLERMVTYNNASWMRRNIWRLRNKKLSCVCNGAYCHGEVLLQYANSDDIGRLIAQYGDDPVLLSEMVERALLAHGKATRTDFESYLSRFERQYIENLTTLPSDVRYRVQVDDLFIERINPKLGN